MLKTYNSMDEVPEALREHYKMSGGKAIPVVSEDHPLVTNGKTLKSQKETAETAKTNAERERDDAKTALENANVLQSGQRAVSKADAELLEAVKAKNVTTKDAFDTLHKEHGEYKTTAEEATAAKHAGEVAAAMGWDKEKTARLVPKHFDLSTVELRDGKDGKKEAVAKVKQSDDTFVEKPFAEVVKATPELSDLQPLLTGKQSPVIATQGVGDPPSDTNPADAYLNKVYGKKAAA